MNKIYSHLIIFATLFLTTGLLAQPDSVVAKEGGVTPITTSLSSSIKNFQLLTVIELLLVLLE